MQKLFNRFERLVVLTLIGFMMVAVFLATLEVGVVLVQRIISPPVFMMDIREIMEVFGFILMVIIGLELLESIKTYLDKRVIHAEVVLLVALVAVARKIIILDYKEMSWQNVTAMAVLVISLSAGFFIVKRAMSIKTDPSS